MSQKNLKTQNVQSIIEDRCTSQPDRYQGQKGRSMVEMLGTLAIMGVLSAGAIGGYSYAMNKHRTNELIYEATKRAQWVGTQLEMNNPNPSLNTFGTDSFGGGRFTGEILQLENGQIGIKVAGLKEAVCQNILNSIGDNTVIREMRDVNCNDDNGTATLVFNRDLSTSDSTISESDPEVSGEASGQATDTAPEETETTELVGDEECNYHGMWTPSTGGSGSCDCYAGYEGSSCDIEINAQPDEPSTSTGEYEPEVTATVAVTAEPEISIVTTTTTIAGPCSGHGTRASGNPNRCYCDYGYGGNDCSGPSPCGEHGWWNACGSRCVCDDGWGGEYCSVENPCSGHGKWLGYDWRPCNCDSGYEGSDCSSGPNVTYCNGHGNWNGSSCNCDAGYGGADCSMTEDEFCNGRGTLNAQPTCCTCNSGWYGARCDFSDARSACNNHGSWSACGCYCDANFGGVFCSEDKSASCSDHGTWWNNGCQCDTGWGGSDCSIDTSCSGHGYWQGSYCNCQSRYDGPSCSIDGNITYCNDHGDWERSHCSCYSPWSGDDCSEHEGTATVYETTEP